MCKDLYRLSSFLLEKENMGYFTIGKMILGLLLDRLNHLAGFGRIRGGYWFEIMEINYLDLRKSLDIRQSNSSSMSQKKKIFTLCVKLNISEIVFQHHMLI